MFEFLLFLVFPAAMAYAAVMDMLTMTIPNRISLLMVAGFMAAVPFSGLDAGGVANHVGAGAMMLALGILMFAQGWLGGGDAKLLSATALWLGFTNILPYLAIVGVLGGFLAMALLLYRSMPPPLLLCREAWALRLHDKSCGIPYGIALAAAGLWIYPSTVWFARLAL